MPYDSAADRDALSLAARQLCGLAIEQFLHLQDTRDRADLGVSLGLGHLAEPQGKADVLVDGPVRVERIGLKHHRDAPVARRDVVAELTVDI